MELMHHCPCCGKNPNICPCVVEERHDPDGHHYAWCATHQRIVALTHVEPGSTVVTFLGDASIRHALP
jgi:formate dehydrogenase maturation protein FdhE